MDMTQQEIGSCSDGEETARGCCGGAGSGITAPAVSTTSTSAEDEQFVDALESFADHHGDRHRGTNGMNGLASSATNANDGNYGTLERCGRWLVSIPRDDVVALQQASEYREFLAAFERLGEAHRRTVTLERQHILCLETEEEDNDGAEMSTNSIPTVSNVNMDIPHPPLSPVPTVTNDNSYQLSPSSVLRRRRYSFLQHLAVDDVLLRVFEFIDCSSLVRTGTACHRFRELTNRSAEQRTQRLADGRLLGSAMKMLRAQEQIEGVGPREESGPFVPIPMLGLRRRVKVAGSGDPEFNGIYFCTGSNGNGFLFTKPRCPERRVRGPMARGGDDSDIDNFQEQEINPMENGPPPPQPFVVDDDGQVAPPDDDEQADVVDDQSADTTDVLYGDEPNRSRLLRCVIAKRFSNETILWYMSKEVVDEETHKISQSFSFWGKLLNTGDAAPEVCQYPSQTSILSQNGEPAWQPLTDTVDVMPPIVELLDE